MIRFESVIPRLPASDLRRTLAFYRDILAFQVDVAWPESNPAFVILERDGARVSFFEPNELQPGPPGYAELYVEVSDATAMHAELQKHVGIEWGPEVYSYGRREFAVRDPDRYLLIFSQPTDDPVTTPEPA